MILGVIGIISGGDDSKENSQEQSLTIEWNEEDQKGYVEFDQELEDGYVKKWVISSYYDNIATLLETVNKDTLKDYEYIEFKANLKKEDGKIYGVIKGDLSIDFIKNYENFSSSSAKLDVEENMENLFLPSFLE